MKGLSVIVFSKNNLKGTFKLIGNIYDVAD